MKNYIFLLLSSFFFLPELLAQTDTAKSDTNFIKIYNSSDIPIFFSYEDKFGNILGVRAVPLDTTNVLIQSNKIRIVFSKDMNIFPCIAEVGETIKVNLENNKIVAVYPEDNFLPYLDLNERFKLIMTPFFGIEFSDKTNYKEILNEIQTYRNERLNHIYSNYPKNKYLEDLKLIIKIKYLREIMAPYYQEGFKISWLPDFYLNEIDRTMEEVLSLEVAESQIDLVKQYYNGIVLHGYVR